MSLEELRYALAKQVSDMNRGFTISTSYGDLQINAGPLADRLQKIVRHALEARLEALEKEAR